MNEKIFDEKSIGLLILAGGKSSRMGKDKSALKLGEKTFIQRLAENMGEFGEKLLSANKGETAEGFVTVADELKAKGPMAGILAALGESQSDALIVVPCDTPFMDRTAAMMLAEKYSGDIVVAESTSGIEPLIGIFPKGAKTAIRAELEASNSKAREIIKKIGFTTVRLPDEKLININTPEDYRKYE